VPIPPANNPPYDTAAVILHTARTRLNDRLDTLQPVSGKALENTSSFTHQIFNTAWRRFQNYLANLGSSRVTREIIIVGLPPVQTIDPAVQVFINWTNYFDGLFYWNTPVLPPDFTYPLKVWERWSGQNLPFPQEPMEMMLEGLPDFGPKQVYNRFCDWREDSLYMPGSLMTTDLRFRYVSLLPDIVDAGQSQWFQQVVPIMNCLDSLAWYIVLEFWTARVGLGAEVDLQAIQVKAEAAAKQVFNRDARLRQRVTVTRQPLSGRGGNSDVGGGYWGG